MPVITRTTRVYKLLLLLGFLSGAAGAICDDKYAEAYPSGDVALTCVPFPGSTTIHGILWGCNTLNQDEEPPANIKSQTFTEICEAAVSPETLYTCYQMASNTDYSAFTGSIDPTLACVGGDAFASPKYQYLQTTGDFTEGGGAGKQSTEVPHLVDDFDSNLAINAFYAKTLTAPQGQVMTPNPALVPSPTESPGTDESEAPAIGPSDAGSGQGESDSTPAPGPLESSGVASAVAATAATTATRTLIALVFSYCAILA